MAGYFSRFSPGPGKEEAEHLIATLNFAIGTLHEPDFFNGDERLGIIARVAEAVDGVLFRPSGFYDPQGRLLFGADGHDPAARWPASLARLLERKADIQRIEATATPEAAERRARSIQRLRDEGVPVNEHLPAIEDSTSARARSTEEVAWRAMALLLVSMKGEGMDRATAERIAANYRLEPHFSPLEKDFIADASPSEHDRIQFAWRYEAAWTLFWALGYIDALGAPVAICDVPRLVGLLRERDAAVFIAEARLRPLHVLLDEADLIYRYHWAVIDARIKGQPAPAGLEGGVVMERHHALNWLIGYMGQHWDDISTDT